MGCGASLKQDPDGLDGGRPPSAVGSIPPEDSAAAVTPTKPSEAAKQKPPESSKTEKPPDQKPAENSPGHVSSRHHSLPPAAIPPSAEPPPDIKPLDGSAQRAASHHGIPHHYDPEPPPAEVAAAAAPDVALECDYLGYSLKDASERKKGPKFHEVLEGDPPVPSTGVSFAALRGFVDRHDKWLGSQPPPTTGEVVQALIRPVVAASGLSCAFAELLAKKDPGCAAKANLFVTHAWQAPFTALFEALSLHVPPGQEASTFLWLDAFCWNQVDLRSSSRAWWMGTFAPAIAACGRTVVVLHPWDSPVALSRAWCLFEMTATLISPRASLAVAATAAEEQRLLSALSSPGFDAKVVALARAVDLRTSKSEVPEDSAGIRGAIAETIGGAALNSAVVERLRTWLADRAHKALSAMPQGSPERGCSALITNLALLLREQGKLEEAAALLREAHESRAKALGDAHEDTLGAATDLASALQADEKLEEARALYERVLEQRRAQTGAEAAEGLFRALEGLAGTFQEEGKLEEAGRAYAEAAESLERMLGPEHDTAIVAALAKTAFDMHKLGRVAEADEKISSLLDRMASHPSMGEKHPTTLLAHFVAADAALVTGRYKEAYGSAKACMDGRTELLGQHHSDTAEAAMMVAASLLQLGRLKEADDVAAGALEELMGSLSGSFHPRCTDAEILLGRVVAERGRRRIAVEALRRCLAKHRNAFTYTALHPKVLSAAEALADAYLQLGKPEVAEELVEEVESGRRRLYSADHPEVAAAVLRRAQLLLAQNSAAAALRLLKEELIPLSERVLGAAHPETLRAVHCAAEAALALGDASPEPAGPLVQRAVDGRTAALGEWHFETLRSVRLKALLADRDKSKEEHGVNAEALKLFEHVARGRLRCLGRRHPDTRLSLSEYAQHASQPERLTAASRLMASEAAAKKAVVGVDDSDEVWEMEEALALASTGASAGGKKTIIVPGHEDVDAIMTSERRLALSRMMSLPPEDNSFMRRKSTLKPSSIELPPEPPGSDGARKLKWTESLNNREAERAEAHEDDDEDDDDYAPAKLLARPGKTGPRKAPIMPAIDSDEDEEEEDEPVVKRPAGKTGPRKLAPPVDDDEEEEDGDDYEPNVLGRPAQPDEGEGAAAE